MSGTTDTGAMGSGGSGYGWSKKTLVGYVEQMALVLAPRMIRVNAIHPTNVNTDLIHNKELYKVFRPDLENPTREDVIPAFTYFQAMPIPYVEPVDISNAVLFLSCDESRYVTGQQLRVDAGSLLRWPNGPR
jgi:NAD(P)-dependent dehydrogenase (short-subunit alcohol dehydrogenase family)